MDHVLSPLLGGRLMIFLGVGVNPLACRSVEARTKVWGHGMAKDGVPIYVPVLGGGDEIVRFHPAGVNLPGALLERVFQDLCAKDPEIYYHGYRVAIYATVLGEALGLSDERLSFLGAASWLHDIGKLHISKAIRFKRDRLTAAEYEEMKEHVRIGARILRSIGAEGYAQIALQHHEWHSGWGYPFGLTAAELSVEAQITSVADAYDAMTAGRCYSRAMGHSRTIAEIARFAGVQFNPVVVKSLLETGNHIAMLNEQLHQGSPSVSDSNFVKLVTAG